MSSLRTRLYTRRALPELLLLVTENARSRWPDPAYLLNSDVAWRLPGSRGDLRLWHDERGLAGYAWFSLVEPSTFDLRGDVEYDGAVAADVLRWLEARRREFEPREPWLIGLRSMAQWEHALAEGRHLAKGVDKVLLVEAFDRDTARIAFLEALGFSATEHFGHYLARSLTDPIPEADLPDGWRIRHVREADFEARVCVHRDAWFRSTFDLAQYLEVRSIDAYDPELDLVAVAPTGEFASYCIGWVDHDLGVGSFEPVGTPVPWRRRGLAAQVQYEGLRRMRTMDMHSAKIGTACFNDRAYGLYTHCGFEPTDVGRTYLKVLK